MRGSITFKFSANVDDYRVRTLTKGDLESGDLEAIIAVLDEEIRRKRLIASGEIVPTAADPTGIGQFHVRWSN